MIVQVCKVDAVPLKKSYSINDGVSKSNQVFFVCGTLHHAFGHGWAGNCAADQKILQSHVQRSCGPSSTNEIDKIKVRCGFAINFVVRP